jgi:hypothetical protein
MTDQEAFAAIMELNRKHKLGIEPDGWRLGPSEQHDQPEGRWYRPITVYSNNAEGNITEYNYAHHTDPLDLQALTATATEWLEKQGAHLVWHIDAWCLFVINNIHTDRCSGGRLLPGKWWTRKLDAILAAIEHCTEGSKE